MRWTPKRKAAIVAAIENGDLSVAEAKRQNSMSDEEIAAWRRDYAAHGAPGLRVTKLQTYGKRSVVVSLSIKQTKKPGSEAGIRRRSVVKRRRWTAITEASTPKP